MDALPRPQKPGWNEVKAAVAQVHNRSSKARIIRQAPWRAAGTG
jgi:hypothetical protein